MTDQPERATEPNTPNDGELFTLTVTQKRDRTVVEDDKGHKWKLSKRR